MPDLSENKARAYIRKRLLEEDWTKEAVDTILEAVEGIDGFWSYGTHRAIKDLAQIYKELEEEHGEAPDQDW